MEPPLPPAHRAQGRAATGRVRIASVVVSLGAGGAENLAVNLGREFARAGHEPVLLTLTDARSLGADPEFGRVAGERAAAGGVAVETLALGERRNPVTGTLALRRLVRRIRPDILHVHTPVALLFAQWPRLGVPIVYTHHNTRLARMRRLVPLFDRVVSHYVAISPALETLLRRLVRGPITQIRNGVPLEDAAGYRRAAERNGLSLLAVGSLTPKKDYRNLIDAVGLARERLERAHGRVRLTVAGEGPEQAMVAERVRALGLDPCVDLAGNVASVGPLLDAADLFVSGAISEGLPIAMLEAAAAGLPLVATDIGGVGEVVRDGVNGRLVAPSDPSALADAIVDAAADRDRLSRWSAASRAVAQEFSIEPCARDHLALYDRVLGAL